jgi:hypothetical protein
MPDAGGCNAEKCLARSLAVMCGGTDRTQAVLLRGKRGTRLARTMRSENVQSHTSRPRR